MAKIYPFMGGFVLAALLFVFKLDVFAQTPSALDISKSLYEQHKERVELLVECEKGKADPACETLDVERISKSYLMGKVDVYSDYTYELFDKAIFNNQIDPEQNAELEKERNEFFAGLRFLISAAPREDIAFQEERINTELLEFSKPITAAVARFQIIESLQLLAVLEQDLALVERHLREAEDFGHDVSIAQKNYDKAEEQLSSAARSYVDAMDEYSKYANSQRDESRLEKGHNLMLEGTGYFQEAVQNLSTSVQILQRLNELKSWSRAE